MKYRHFPVLILVFIFVAGTWLNGQITSDSEYVYYNAAQLVIEGRIQSDSAYEGLYDRMPFYMKGKVRKAVWDLAKNSAGISVRFASNTGSIKLQWKILNDLKMNHMAETGIKGIDIYFRENTLQKWQYLNTARPKGVKNSYVVLKNAKKEMREYKLYLPLYDGTTELLVGIQHDARLETPEKENTKPIIYYGTSITQGGCASRPGMTYPAIIERETDIPAINLGFSGNGRMEPEIAEFMAECDAALYVIDCAANMKAKQIKESVAPLVKTLRGNGRETPIIFVEGFNYTNGALDDTTRILINNKNKILNSEYLELKRKGIKNIYMMKIEDVDAFPGEGAVDGVHLTDYGFRLFADMFIKKLKELGIEEIIKPKTKKGSSK